MKNVKMRNLIIVTIMMLSLTFSAYASDIYIDDSTNILLSLINQNPNPANAGDVATVYVGLENIGGIQAKDLILEFIPSYPFSIAPGESLVQEVGSIGAYQGADGDSIKIVNFKIKVDKDTSAGTYKMNFKYYNANQEYLFEKSIYVAVDAKQSAEIVKIDKTVLVPGEETAIKFTINNVGSAPLKNVVFYWENEDDIILPVGSDNTKYVNYIEVGKSADLEYNVIADTNADAGLYKLNLYLKYEDSSTGAERETDTIAGVYVGGETDFEVAFSESSSGQMSFSVANTGSNPANSISVVIPEQTGWTITGSSSAIIGNLNQGDYTVASFTLQQSSSSATFPQNSAQGAVPPTRDANSTLAGFEKQNLSKSNIVKVQIVYTNTMGKRITVEKEVKVSGTTSSSTISAAMASANYPPSFGRVQNQSFLQKYRWYLLGVIIFIIGAIVFWHYRRRKLENAKPETEKGFFNKNKK
jgi:hypothetical protein